MMLACKSPRILGISEIHFHLSACRIFLRAVGDSPLEFVWTLCIGGQVV